MVSSKSSTCLARQLKLRDAVIITASNPSNEIISQSAQMSRKRGRIVLVGVIGLDIKRSDFYEKELSFQVSCSTAPGATIRAMRRGQRLSSALRALD